MDFLAYHCAYCDRFINDFSKALASEVRIILHEVGQLREERPAVRQSYISDHFIIAAYRIIPF
jgi:hypothetical protein